MSHLGIASTWMIDMLMIEHPFRIDFHSFDRLYRKSFGELPQLVFADSLIRCIRDNTATITLRCLHREITPPIRMTEMEIRHTAHWSKGKSHSIMLTKIAIRPATCIVFQLQIAFLFSCDNINNTGYSIRAIKCRSSTFYNLYTFDTSRINLS